jgi:ketosteroid isomerase-like protein
VETREAARRWSAAWDHAWREHDAEALLPVYAEDCVHYSHPFRDPGAGHDGVLGYARWAFEGEHSARPRFEEPLVDGDRAAVEWWTTVVGTDGSEDTIAGCSILRFGSDGRVVQHIDYWASEQGHRQPPETWGSGKPRA